VSLGKPITFSLDVRVLNVMADIPSNLMRLP
jgi:hypothetical protein